MATDAHKETLEFQAEVQQLLHLMIHSLYSNKDIFLRELISNASDAIDKLRFQSLQDESLLEGEGDLRIRVSVDKDARTITVADNGIGMTRDEVAENLGTIARSGTKAFLEQLTGDQQKDAKLIGQFGVGFYSAFVVAEHVTVHTRKAGLGAEHGVRWSSDGKGAYTLESEENPERGTRVVLTLPESQSEYLDDWRLKGIIRRYSDHIDVPIQMPAQAEDKAEDKDEQEDEAEKAEAAETWETVNNTNALWMRAKSEISDDDYKAFYKHVAHDFDDPMVWLHNHVEGRQSYTSLLYIPKNPPFDLYEREPAHGIKLYVRRVFIMEDTEKLMPRYLRFVRGLVDSDDLPLNVSRELLQHNPLLDKIRSASVKRILDRLEKMAKNEPEQYAEFYGNFGKVLKEGVAEDFANRERIAKLLRFSTTQDEDETPAVSLDDYIARMKEGQEAIYYVTAESFNAARNSPHLEVFRKKGVEVLLLPDPVDEWVITHLNEYDGKPLKSVAKGGLDLGDLEDQEEKKAAEEATESHKDLLEKLKGALADKVSEVRVSTRLTDSPACLVVGEYDFGMGMQRLLKAAGHAMPQGKPALEINIDHPIVQRLDKGLDDARFSDWAAVLHDQALLTEGGQLEDPAAFVKRVNALLTEQARADEPKSDATRED